MWRKLLERSVENEFLYYFLRSTSALVSATICLIIILTSISAPLIVSTSPYDLTSFDLLDSLTPPVWEATGSAKFLLGTDDQGRDLLSAILYGTSSPSIFVVKR